MNAETPSLDSSGNLSPYQHKIGHRHSPSLQVSGGKYMAASYAPSLHRTLEVKGGLENSELIYILRSAKC